MIGRLSAAKALGLLVAALALVAAMTALGLWQFGVYDDHQRADALALRRAAPIALDRALEPDGAFPPDSVGRTVSVDGRYDGAGQLYVRGLPGAGREYAVVTPLVTASGSAVLVVRGSSRFPRSPAPQGPVHIEGVLQPSQPEGSILDARRVTDGIRISGLVNEVVPDLYAGYVVETTSDPPEHLAPVSPPLPDPSRLAGVRNLIYALQWWVFAGFVAFMWWRIVFDADPDETEALDVEASEPEAVG